jgi:hypothetical protein
MASGVSRLQASQAPGSHPTRGTDLLPLICALRGAAKCRRIEAMQPTMTPAKINVALVEVTSMDLSIWSDLHKDVYGCRPRFRWLPTLAEYDAEMDRLQRLLAIDEEMDRKRQLDAQYRFERSIEYHIRRGDATCRRGGIMCAIEAYDRYAFKLAPGERPDWEFLCYKLGLPYALADQLRLDWEGGLA